MILATVLPATLGAFLYVTSGPWWRGNVGRALAVAWTSIAVLICWIAAFIVFGDDFPYRKQVRDAVFTGVFIGMTYKFVVVAAIRWANRRSR
jgi:hypothetical protein